MRHRAGVSAPVEKVRRRRGRGTGGVAPAAIMFSRCDMVSDYSCRRSTVPLILLCRGLPARFRGRLSRFRVPPFASAPSRPGNLMEYSGPSDACCLTFGRDSPHLASRHRPTRLERTSIAFGASVPEIERRDGYAHVLDVQEQRQTQVPRPRRDHPRRDRDDRPVHGAQLDHGLARGPQD